MAVRIQHIKHHKKRFLKLLLLGDEQESMIDKYLDRGDLYVLSDQGIKTVCVVTNNGDNIYEIKNLATDVKAQNQGYGHTMIQFICNTYQGKGRVLLVGTGNNPSTLHFYESCGFTFSHTLPRFFTDNYDHPIFENGIQLIDMIYLKKNL